MTVLDIFNIVGKKTREINQSEIIPQAPLIDVGIGYAGRYVYATGKRST